MVGITIGSCSLATGAGGSSVGSEMTNPMKTFQTTSYRTGDDGDLEKGRLVNSTTLTDDNPFGNTNRYTDEAGGQTYTSGVRIDWSTWDGVTVLGWDLSKTGSVKTWNTAIDDGLANNYGGHATGWRLPNVNELTSMFDYSVSAPLNYAPLNTTQVLWTSTTQASTTTNALYSVNNGTIAGYAKTNTRRQIYVRSYTGAELGI